MKIEMSINGSGNIMKLTLDDFLLVKYDSGVPQIGFVRNHMHVGNRGYSSVAVTAIIDGVPKQRPALSMPNQLMELDLEDQITRCNVFILTKFELFIHHISNPKHDVKIRMERCDLSGIEIFRDADLLGSMIHPILDIVDQIINFDWMIIENYQISFSDMFNIFKAILIGIAENPNLASQIGNMLVALSLEPKEKYLQEKYMQLCIAICETIHTSTQLYEIYKCISTPMRKKLIEHFLDENKPEIVVQLTHFSNPIKIEDITNDDRWTL